MKNYQQILDETKVLFENEFDLLLKNNIDKKDTIKKLYFYWEPSFYINKSNKQYTYFKLSTKEIESINEIGKQIFDNDKIKFETKGETPRIYYQITNFNLLFDKNLPKGETQNEKLSFISEYILYKIFSSKLDDFGYLIEKQKQNCIIEYFKYITSRLEKPLFLLKEYTSFLNHKKYSDIIEAITNNKCNNNIALQEKISKLYYLKNTNIDFIFSIEDNKNKEELRELLELMAAEQKDNKNVYRGQANAYWELNASLTREPKFYNNEIKMYYDILALKPDAFYKDKTIYERLITMQHFEMPTRLLDVTRNPLISIFFSCYNKEHQNEDSIIYIFDTNNMTTINFENEDLHNFLKKYYSKDIDENQDIENKNKAIKNLQESSSLKDGKNQNLFFLNGIATNERIYNQCGDFIYILNNDIDAQKTLNHIESKKIIIDSKTKKILLEQLASLNIHGGTVYPDLTHVSKYIKGKYEETINTQPTQSTEENHTETTNTQATRSTEENNTEITNTQAIQSTQENNTETKNTQAIQSTEENNTETTNTQATRSTEDNNTFRIEKDSPIYYFSIENELILEKVSDIIEAYLFNNILPRNTTIAEALQIQPSLEDRERIIAPIKEQLISLLEQLNPEHHD